MLVLDWNTQNCYRRIELAEDTSTEGKNSEQPFNRIEFQALDAREQRSLDVVSKDSNGQPAENPFKNLLKSSQSNQFKDASPSTRKDE